MSIGTRVSRPVLVLFILATCAAGRAEGQWSRQPGDRARNHFGPSDGRAASTCRGACGPACPSTCEATVSYECTAPGTLRRVRSFSCGTHQACRAHDDCLDRCRQRRTGGLDCDMTCNADIMDRYGLENATSWLKGGGPFDATPIRFEYTREIPDGPDPVYRCPDGATLACAGGAGRCLTGAGREVNPVFDSYAGRPGTMRISGVRAGRVCGDGGPGSTVCEETTEIALTGQARCTQADGAKPCTWYGVEFDYANANPAVALACFTAGAGEDFLGGAVKGLLTSMPADQSSELGQALGHIQGELGRGRSLTDVLSGIRVTPAGGGGTAGAAGTTTAVAGPGVPPSVRIPAASGHLVVPMFELSDAGAPGSVLVRDVRCTQNGTPVLEATFRLRVPGR